jgi:bifunctional DNA-binding transcriptional regulator/antitoxin component of YhaV-PrlF toxin-antitoxin module
MKIDYQKVWSSLNDLEMVTSKISSAREILDSAIDALESGNHEKTETMMYVADEFLQYYLKEFDELFKIAWKETVVKLKEEDPCMPPWGHSDLEYGLANFTSTEDRISNFPEENTICDKDDSSPECKGAWTSFWEENYYPEEYKGSTVSSVKQDKVKRWVLPVEEVENGDTGEQEYFITFPNDLLESTNLKEGDEVEWIDNNDGTYTLKKTGDELARVKTYKEIGNELARVKTYAEMIEDGWTMTADGFWIKE